MPRKKGAKAIKRAIEKRSAQKNNRNNDQNKAKNINRNNRGPAQQPFVDSILKALGTKIANFNPIEANGSVVQLVKNVANSGSELEWTKNVLFFILFRSFTFTNCFERK